MNTSSPETKSPLPSSQTLHQQLRENLRTEILGGRYKPGSQIPTEAEMISNYGVSKITVRRALQDLTSEGLLVGHRGKGTFVNPSKFSTAATLLFIHAEETSPQHPYTQMLINGVHSENSNARPFRVELMARPYMELQSDDDTTVEQLAKHARISGIVALPRLRKAQVQRLLDMDIPVAIIEHTDYETLPGMVTIETGPSSVYDYQLRHIKEIGADRVGIITDYMTLPPTHIDNIRLTMKKFDVPIIEDAFEPADFGINDARAATLRLLDRHPDLDAIIAIDDLTALGALMACQERGLRVPDQIAIIGSGNMLGDHSHCGITTVDTQLEKHGKLAARAVLRMISGRDVEPRILIEPTLLRRSSS